MPFYCQNRIKYILDQIYLRLKWCELCLPCGLPRWPSSKEFACSAGDAGDAGLIPGCRRSPRGRHGNPLQYSCLENPVNRETWQAAVHRVVQNRMWLKWLGSYHPCNRWKVEKQIDYCLKALRSSRIICISVKVTPGSRCQRWLWGKNRLSQAPEGSA